MASGVSQFGGISLSRNSRSTLYSTFVLCEVFRSLFSRILTVMIGESPKSVLTNPGKGVSRHSAVRVARDEIDVRRFLSGS